MQKLRAVQLLCLMQAIHTIYCILFMHIKPVKYTYSGNPHLTGFTCVNQMQEIVFGINTTVKQIFKIGIHNSSLNLGQF